MRDLAEAIWQVVFLEFCDMRNRKDGCPYWVPDWSTRLSHEPIIFGYFVLRQSSAAGVQIIDNELLEVFGIVCGVVDWKEITGSRADHGLWYH
jgi:hypothetical protein